MASLYDSTSRARKILLAFLALAVLILVYENVQNFASQEPVTVQRQNRFYMEVDRNLENIPVPKIPTVSFSGSPSYTLESVHSLYPDIAYVYSIDQPRETLLSYENALIVVETLGFDKDQGKETGSLIEWKSPDGSKTLTYDRVLQVWKLRTNFALNSNAIATKRLLTDVNEYAQRVLSFANRLNFNSRGLENPLAESRYVEIGLNDIFVETESSQSAEYASVNIFKQLDYADLKPTNIRPALEPGEVLPNEIDAPVYSSDPRKGQIRMLVTNQSRDLDKELFELDYIDFNYGQKGAYLVVTPDEAWNNIQRGGGSLVLLQPQNSNYFGTFNNLEVTRFVADARQTKVAYFEPETWDGFVYPIYVFTGRAELADGRQAKFIYFVDAIKRA